MTVLDFFWLLESFLSGRQLLKVNAVDYCKYCCSRLAIPDGPECSNDSVSSEHGGWESIAWLNE